MRPCEPALIHLMFACAGHTHTGGLTMPLQPAQQIQLSDRQDRDLGQIQIDRIQGDLVFGRFTPGPDYPQVQRLFAEYVEAANDQLLSIVGELDAAIRELGLRLRAENGRDLPGIDDVQIGEGIVTFRTKVTEGASLLSVMGDHRE